VIEKSRRPLSVLYLIADHTRMAGANRSVLELVRNLPSNVVPHVVITAPGKVADAFASLGVDCEVIEPGPAMNTFGGWIVETSLATRAAIALRELLPFTFRLRRVIRRHGIGVVHINDARGALLAATAARLTGVPIVGHLHGELLFSGPGRWIMEHVPARIVAVSNGARRTLSPRARRKAATVYNGMAMTVPELSATPVPFLETLRAQGVKVVCCFASTVPFKGCHHLIDALAVLNARGWRERLAVLWIGDFIPVHQKYNDWLAGKLRDHGIDNFTFTGWHDSPFSFYRYADATVLPSVSEETLEFDGQSHRVVGGEGFPITNLEAMAFGIPVVASRISGIPEQVEHGTTGLLVAPGDATALADALEQLLSAPTTAAAMGVAGARRVEERFSTREFVEGILRVYGDAAAGTRRGHATHREVFGDIYRRNLWGNTESVSGPGSTRARGADFTPDLVALLRRLESRTLLDAPCGDFNWIAEAAGSVERYVGIDVVPELIEHNLRHHLTDRRSFARADITRDDLPAADVILCRDCLVHFSIQDVWNTLANFRRSGSRYLLTTTFIERDANGSIRTGSWQPLNLQAAPFHFPAPLELIDERCTHSGGSYRDKRLALWELASLPLPSAPAGTIRF
jgi:glycosyltransferase involved in cell wall biosynthesis/SAM-dependent methyltransferase